MTVVLAFLRIPTGKAPRFPKKPTIRQEGDILIMECVLEANPAPEITWYQGEKVIEGSGRVRMSRKATGRDTFVLTLEVSEPTVEDGGNYRCNAFNNYGESNANIALNFQGTPTVFVTRSSLQLLQRSGGSSDWRAEQSCHPLRLTRRLTAPRRRRSDVVSSLDQIWTVCGVFQVGMTLRALLRPSSRNRKSFRTTRGRSSRCAASARPSQSPWSRGSEGRRRSKSRPKLRSKRPTPGTIPTSSPSILRYDFDK